MTDIPSSPPYIWPGLLNRAQLSAFPDTNPFESILYSSKIILGLIYDLDDTGICWLADKFHTNENLCGKLIVGLYPACKTTRTLLEQLDVLSSSSEGQIEFRLKVLSENIAPLWTTLLAFTENNARQYTFIGPSPNLALNAIDPAQLNLAFAGDAATNSILVKWFDWLWMQSSGLTAQTMNLPALVPAHGTIEAAQQWEDYVAKFKTLVDVHVDDLEQYYDDPKDENPIEAASDPQTPVSIQLGIPPLDKLTERVARLYEVGQLAAIDRQSRSRPLDAPMKPEWFGIKPMKHKGGITRETRYRISAFDQDTWSEIEKRQKAVGSLLARFSFQLNEGVHWMPRAAQSMFELELKRISSEGKKLVADVLQNNVDGFLEKQRPQIEKDANDMYQEFAPGKLLEPSIIDKILESLKGRLTETMNGGLAPQVTINRIQFDASSGPESNAQWSQALTLLLSIARFHRKAITDSRYFFRGLRVPEDEYVDAMNPSGDKLVQVAKSGRVTDRAAQELEFIYELEDAKIEYKRKCEILFELMDGADVNVLWRRLVSPSGERRSIQ